MDNKVKMDLSNIDEIFPEDLDEAQKAEGKTLFLKKLAEKLHSYYGGKIQTGLKSGLYGFNWFNVWYTPGVSEISTTIRDDNERSFELSNRGNLVGVISDSTRVLGDGDVTPPGGLGVMEGKSFLMKYLGGVDAFPLCMDSKDESGENDPDNMIEFVKRAQHSFGAINLEDISQPNCYKVLDTLREECDIPVWHDDAQGTACVTLAGLLNALKLAEKKLSEAKIVLYGAGAANTSIVRIAIKAGADPDNIIVFDSKGSLNDDRDDLLNDCRNDRKRNLCRQTNPQNIQSREKAFENADVLIALSAPGPDTIKQDWISRMAEKAIVFACANPVPEIYPYAAKEAGAFITATGRGDFANQVNNSLGFPGILKGALSVRASKITDKMAIVAAESLAEFAEDKGLDTDYIIPDMENLELFAKEAADVAQQAIEDGVARKQLSWQEVYDKAEEDIKAVRKKMEILQDQGLIKQPDEKLLDEALQWTIDQIQE